MKETSKTEGTAPAARISSFLLLVVFVTLALSFVALIFGISTIDQSSEAASILLLLGFLGVALSTYVLFQTRRRLAKMRIVVPPVVTTIECKKCGVKNVREFQRGDYIFKEGEPCQKCNDKMLITAIYREVKDREKERITV
jgi:DNA integrity scanning protein DisA with diadenylate cyclase activity